MDFEQAAKYENENGQVVVKNENELKEFVTAAGWSSIEEFEAEHHVRRDEVYNKPFTTCKGSLSFAG